MTDYELQSLQKSIKLRLLNINAQIRHCRKNNLEKNNLQTLKDKRKETDQLYQRSLKIKDNVNFLLIKNNYLKFI
jgi:hypothetical protein